MARLVRGGSRARPDPAERGYEAARGRAELRSSSGLRLGVHARERGDGSCSRPRRPRPPSTATALGLFLDRMESVDRHAVGVDAPQLVRSIPRRTTRRPYRPRSRWSATRAPSSTCAARAPARGQIELLDPVGAPEPDGVACDRERRRAAETRLRTACLARVAGSIRVSSPCPRSRAQTASVADGEPDGFERHREQSGLVASRAIRPAQVAELRPDLDHAENASFVEGDPDRSLTRRPTRSGSRRRGIPCGDEATLVFGSILVSVFPSGSTTQTAPSPAAISGELKPTGISATTSRATGSTTPTDPGGSARRSRRPSAGRRRPSRARPPRPRQRPRRSTARRERRRGKGGSSGSGSPEAGRAGESDSS